MNLDGSDLTANAWRQQLPQLTPENFDACRWHLAFGRWKHRMWKKGFKMSTQLAGGRSECLCGAAIDLGSTEQHVYDTTRLRREKRERPNQWTSRSAMVFSRLCASDRPP